MDTVLLAVFIIVLALVFDFLNGMNDAANSIATIVSTRVLTPKKANCLKMPLQLRVTISK